MKDFGPASCYVPFPAPSWRSRRVPSWQGSPPQALQREPPSLWQVESLGDNRTPQKPQQPHLPSRAGVFTIPRLTGSHGPLGRRAFLEHRQIPHACSRDPRPGPGPPCVKIVNLPVLGGFKAPPIPFGTLPPYSLKGALKSHCGVRCSQFLLFPMIKATSS